MKFPCSFISNIVKFNLQNRGINMPSTLQLDVVIIFGICYKKLSYNNKCIPN